MRNNNYLSLIKNLIVRDIFLQMNTIMKVRLKTSNIVFIYKKCLCQ